jgi:hypothetical protein
MSPLERNQILVHIAKAQTEICNAQSCNAGLRQPDQAILERLGGVYETLTGIFKALEATPTDDINRN